MSPRRSWDGAGYRMEGKAPQRCWEKARVSLPMVTLPLYIYIELYSYICILYKYMISYMIQS